MRNEIHSLTGTHLVAVERSVSRERPIIRQRLIKQTEPVLRGRSKLTVLIVNLRTGQ